MPRVTTIDPRDPRWDRFVEAHPRASVYQLGAWPEILKKAYGFQPTCLALEHDGELHGVMPLMRSVGALSGKRLRSLPAMPLGGPLAETAAGEAELLRAACAMTSERAKSLTVLTRGEGYEQHVTELSGRPKHPTWIMPLPDDPEELRAGWRKSSKNLHRSLNKAAKSGVSVREGRGEADLRAFYRLYMATMKAHHALPRSYRQLSHARRLLAPRGVFRLFVADHEGETIAAGVFHSFRDTIDLLYNGSDPAKLDLRPNHALYWHVIQWGIENGFRHFDFGEAKPDSPLERFKAQWSSERVPEFRYDYVVGEAPNRADALRHAGDRMGRAGGASRKEELLSKAWDAAPLPLTRLAGEVAYRFV
jgi:lipid II:glycine glycyltransferase (peptidoglycan interpeptide bridge formation enzyme)